MKPERGGSRVPVSAAGAGHRGLRSVIVWQVLSALLLLIMGGIHLVLALRGAGSLGKPFWVNAVGGLVLAIAMVVLRGRLLLLASVLSTLFMAGTLLALVLALTVGLFGIGETLSYRPVPHPGRGVHRHDRARRDDRPAVPDDAREPDTVAWGLNLSMACGSSSAGCEQHVDSEVVHHRGRDVIEAQAAVCELRQAHPRWGARRLEFEIHQISGQI